MPEELEEIKIAATPEDVRTKTPLTQANEELVLSESDLVNASTVECLNDRPEKVRKLEILGAAGFPVPELRRSFSHGDICHFADHLEQIAEDADLLAYVESLRGKNIIGRSAHPEEDQFSGGAFESQSIEIPEDYAVEHIWMDLYAAWSLTAERSDPLEPEAIRVRRDIRQRGIEDFDPYAMGIYLNEVVPFFKQITVIPLTNGNFQLMFEVFRYSYNDAVGSELKLVELSRRDDEVDFDELEKLFSERALEMGLGKGTGNYGVLPDAAKFYWDIIRAQELLSENQELEIILTPDGRHVFVQAKTVEPKAIEEEPVKISKERFDAGWEIEGRVDKLTEGDEIRRVKMFAMDDAELLRIDETGDWEAAVKYYEGIAEAAAKEGGYGVFVIVRPEIFNEGEKNPYWAEQYYYQVYMGNTAYFSTPERRGNGNSIRLRRLKKAIFENADVIVKWQRDRSVEGGPISHHLQTGASGSGQTLVQYDPDLHLKGGPRFQFIGESVNGMICDVIVRKNQNTRPAKYRYDEIADQFLAWCHDTYVPIDQHYMYMSDANYDERGSEKYWQELREELRRKLLDGDNCFKESTYETVDCSVLVVDDE